MSLPPSKKRKLASMRESLGSKQLGATLVDLVGDEDYFRGKNKPYTVHISTSFKPNNREGVARRKSTTQLR